MTGAPARRGATRQRLMEAALRLFAQQGFRQTTVGEIEAAVGLQPRRGALYRHFASKEALLDAVVREHTAGLREARDRMLALPAGEVRPVALQAGALVLEELRRERAIVDVLERDGDRIPQCRDLMREEISDVAYRAMTDLLAGWLGRPPGSPDLAAPATLLLGGLINVHRSAWTFGAMPLGLDEQAYVEAWADQCADVVEGLRSRPATGRT